MDDARLASALQRGADGALSRVYTFYAPRLYDYCLTFLADPESAADALHEAMLVAASWAPHLSDRSHFRLWLYAITRNECLRKLRGNAGPSLGVGERPRRAMPASGRTDPVLREVTDLVFRHNFTPADVAAVTGMPVRRARSLCSRSTSVLSRDRRAGTGIGRQVRPSLPTALRDRVLASAAAPSRVAYRGELAMPRQRSGFPVPLTYGPAHHVRRRTLVKAAAIVTALAGLAVGISAAALNRQQVLGLVQAGSGQSTAPSAGGRSGGSPSTPPRWEPAPLPSAGDPVVVVKRGHIGAAAATRKCLDVRGGGPEEGAPVLLQPCQNDARSQDWTLGADGTIRSLGKCMTAPEPGSDATVQLRTCVGDSPQQWNPQLDSTLLSVPSGRCLELPNGDADDFTLLTVATCTASRNQQWTLPS
jgi:DNA-directed RNA polymerase specialized sigma24 family protein